MVDRKEIDRIIHKNGAKDWWQPGRFVANTKPLLPSELEILAEPPEAEKNYNCFLYALGLSENETIVHETGGFIYDTFIQKLIKENELEKTTTPTQHDYVIYQNLENYPDVFTHIGVIKGNKIVSKWAWGPLIKHELWDVPESYGNDVFYLKHISPQTTLHLFENYRSYNIKPVN